MDASGKLIKTLDLYDLLIDGDSSNDVMLKSGDVIFITPVGDQVTIISGFHKNETGEAEAAATPTRPLQ